MAQNTASVTATRGTVPGTANDSPVAPALFTTTPRRDYIPDAARVGDGIATPEMAAARQAYAQGDYASARSEAKRVLKDKASSPQARMEAADLLDRTDIDHGPIAAAISFLILLALMVMFVATNGK
jgi:hypothetical protein